MPIKFLLLGGGGGGGWGFLEGGGWKRQFYFYGRGDFSETVTPEEEKDRGILLTSFFAANRVFKDPLTGSGGPPSQKCGRFASRKTRHHNKKRTITGKELQSFIHRVAQEPETGTVGIVFPGTKRRTGTAGTVFQEPKPEPSSLLNCTETHKIPLLRGTTGTENRNRSNRSIPKLFPNRTEPGPPCLPRDQNAVETMNSATGSE